MTIRRLVIDVGDSLCAGATPASGLSPGYPQLLGVRPTTKIWNFVTQSWQSYEAGVNSYTAVPGSPFFGPEVSYREAPSMSNLLAPSEELWVFKAGIYSSLLLKWRTDLLPGGGGTVGSNYLSWLPQGRDTAYTLFYSQLQAAMTALQLGGHTAEPRAIVITLGTADALSPAGRLCYRDLVTHFAQQIQKDLETILSMSPGSLGTLTVIFRKIHNSYQASGSNAAGIAAVRAATEQAASQLYGAKLVRTDDLIVLGDNVHYNVDSNVLLGTRTGELIAFGNSNPATDGPIPPEEEEVEVDGEFEPDNPLDLYLMIGDSHHRGLGAVADLPDYMKQAGGFVGVKIWNPHADTGAAFETLEVDVNNLVTIDQETNPTVGLFGPEFSFAEAARMRHKRQIYLIKGALDGSCGAKSDDALPVSFPFFDGQCNDWNPASHGELFDRIINGWATDAVQKLIDTFGEGRVVLRGIAISLGTNDAAKIDKGLQAREVGSAVQSLIERIRAWAVGMGISSSSAPARAVLLLPSSSYQTLPLPEVHADEARTALLKIAGLDQRINFVDPTALARNVDNVHYTGASNLEIGIQEFEALWSDQVDAAVPLFCPTRDYLVNGLRLKAVPEASNAQELIDEGITCVRSNFFRRLGSSVILALQAIGHVRQPKSERDYLRLLAQTTETKWVRLELMRTMPLQFVDGSAPDATWQNEPAFRSATIATLASEMKRIRLEIDEALEVLAGKVEITDPQGLLASAIGPDETPSAPGDSVRVQGGAF